MSLSRQAFPDAADSAIPTGHDALTLRLADHAPFGIYLLDADLRIAYMNPCAQRGAFRGLQPIVGRDFKAVIRLLWPSAVAVDIVGKIRHTLQSGVVCRGTSFTERRPKAQTAESYEWELHRIGEPGQYVVACYYFDSTKLRQAEAEARVRAAELEAVLDAVPAAVFVTRDQQARHIEPNRFCIDEFGMRPGSNVSLSAPEGPRSAGFRVLRDGIEISPETLPVQLAAARGHETRNDELEVVFDDGKSRKLLGNAAPVRDRDGRVTGAVGAYIDVTERRLAEQALQESERLYRSLFSLTPLGISVIEPDGSFYAFNDHAHEQLGYTREEFVALRIWDIDENESADSFRRRVAELVSKAGSIEFHVRHRKKNRELMDIRVRKRAVQLGGATRIISVWQDETANKVATAKLQLAHQTLSEREEQLRLATDAAEVGLWDVDPVDDTLFWPPRVKAMFGISADVPVSMADFYAGLHGADRQRVTDAFGAALDPQQRALYDVEYRTVGKEDGLIRWVAAKGRAIFDENDTCVRVIGTAIDITARKHAEEQLRQMAAKLAESEDRLRIALEAVQAGAFDWNLETDEVHWSDSHFRLLGLRQDGGTSPSYALWRTHIHLDDIERVEAAIQHTIRTGEDYHAEFRIIGSDGAERSALAHGVIVTRPDQPRRLVGAMVDVTLVKRAQANEWASERRFRLMADGVPASIWVLDTDGRIEFVNREYCAFFGVTLEMVQKTGWEPIVHADDLPQVIAALSEAMRSHTPFRTRARVRHASGAWRWLDSSGVPRFSSTEEYLGHVGLSSDVTEIVATQQALERADRRKNEFLATLSHELRNPLAPIRTAADVLASQRVTAEQSHSARQVIQRQVRQMAALLEDLLDVARITQGKLELRKTTVLLTHILDLAVEAARPLINNKHHELSIKLPAEKHVSIHGDATRLSQVITNLLTNAAKYTTAHGHIELIADVHQEWVQVCVRDNGIGILPEEIPQLFTMFTQIKGPTGMSEGGLGVGLALSKGLVELHGGTIEARSSGPAAGSEFIVSLPRAHLTVHSGTEGLGEDGPSPAVSRRVLIVDDNRDAADSLAMLLQLEGHEVRAAYSGNDALTTAQIYRPEVILLDIGMPGMDGYAVAKSLRKEAWAASMMLIALTGWGQEDDRKRAMEVGFDAHLTKPVDTRAVIAMLKSTVTPTHQTSRPDSGESGHEV